VLPFSLFGEDDVCPNDVGVKDTSGSIGSLVPFLYFRGLVFPALFSLPSSFYWEEAG